MGRLELWLVVAALLLAMELLTPGFVLIFFAVGAVASAIVAAVAPNIADELVTFAVVSLVSMFAGRHILVRRFLHTTRGRLR